MMNKDLLARLLKALYEFIRPTNENCPVKIEEILFMFDGREKYVPSHEELNKLIKLLAKEKKIFQLDHKYFCINSSSVETDEISLSHTRYFEALEMYKSRIEKLLGVKRNQ